MSSSELTDFGVVYDPTKQEDEQKAEDETKGSRRKKRRKGGRRQKLEFTVEETKDNQVVCNKVGTRKEDLVKYTQNRRQRQYSDAVVLGGTRLSGYCHLTPVPEHQITVSYEQKDRNLQVFHIYFSVEYLEYISAAIYI